MSSARIERYRVEEDEGKPESSQGLGIRLPIRTSGPRSQALFPSVPDSLVRHLKEVFPNKVPPRSLDLTPERALIDVAQTWGSQAVIEYLEHLIESEKNTNP